MCSTKGKGKKQGRSRGRLVSGPWGHLLWGHQPGLQCLLCTTLRAAFPSGKVVFFLLLPRFNWWGGQVLPGVLPQTCSLRQPWQLPAVEEEHGLCSEAESCSVSLLWLSHISPLQQTQREWVPGQGFGMWPVGNSRQTAEESLRNSFSSLEFILS